MGSGIRNVFKFTPAYTAGTTSEFIEEDVFKTIIPLKATIRVKELKGLTWEEVSQKLGDRLGDRLGDNEWKILVEIWNNPTISILEITKQVGLSSTAIENNVNKLRFKGLLEREGSAKSGYWKIIYEEIKNN